MDDKVPYYGTNGENDLIYEKAPTKTEEDKHRLAKLLGLNGASDDDVGRMIFNSAEEAEAFYLKYSKLLGFGVRIRDSQTSSNGEPRMVKWVCSKEGHRNRRYYELPNRKRKPKAETRVGCQARFRINYDEGLKIWIVSDFISKHNHTLVSQEHVQFLNSNRNISDGDKAFARAMRLVGFKASQVIDYLAHQNGGYHKLGFTKKDLYNFQYVDRKTDVHNGDAQTTLTYFATIKTDDNGFFFEKSLTKKNELGSLFWSDSRSRVDYACFGDTIAFDAAYQRNSYNKPVVMILGVNHHHQTIVFGCALLEDEQANSYVWLLSTFLECMGGKKPISVVTDGDKSMAAAIERVFPEARHRLCSWHLEQNALRHVKAPDFVADFKSVLFDRMDADQFDRVWMALLAKYNLEKNQWAKSLYTDRHMWAEAFLKPFYFGGIRTTSRCEGMHAYINLFMNNKLKIFEFVKLFEIVLTKIRFNECQADHESSYSTPVYTSHLTTYEKQAPAVYTRTSFNKFMKELSQESNYIPASTNEPQIEGECYTYKLRRFESQARVRTVVVNLGDGTIKCSCMMLESMGLLCRHAIAAMKLSNLSCISESCIKMRWTKAAKSTVALTSNGYEYSDDVVAMFRCGSLIAKCNSMCSIASKSEAAFDEITKEVMRLIKHLEDSFLHASEQAVGDPKPIRTKGMAAYKSSNYKKKVRKCGHCKQAGHTRPRCPLIQHANSTIEGSDEYAFDSDELESVERNDLQSEPALESDEPQSQIMVKSNGVQSTAQMPSNPVGLVPYGTMTSLLAQVQGSCPWFT